MSLILQFDIVLVPFEEDSKDAAVWFLDHDYLESMYAMFKKVNGMSELFLLAHYLLLLFL